MNNVKTLILRTAGTNCDVETAHAFKIAGSTTEFLHINALIKNRKKLSEFQILAIPGGFSYGDDIASGKILANELKHSLKEELSAFIKSGKLVIGICNGFQILVKMGLLPDGSGKITATLTLNDSAKFESRWVHLAQPAAGTKCVWTSDMPAVFSLPVAHGEGKFMPADRSALEKLSHKGQIVLRYTGRTNEKPAYPENPNGSMDDIAGICDPSGRIFGLMPHPERHITPLQHPLWRRAIDVKEMGAGLHIFKNGVNFVRKHL